MKIDNKLILEHSKNLTLLYVEDDEIIRNATKKIFSNYFKEVDIAVDGEEGLEKFLQLKKNNDIYYDLVVSDINMPRMNGIDMSAAIIKENPEQSIVLNTAHNETAFLQEAINIGVDSFLNKPIHLKQFTMLLYKITQAIYFKKAL